MKCQEMSNCVHSTVFFGFFFFAAESGGSKCQWEMRTDEQGCVCRQMRGWRGGRRGVGNSERTVWRSGLSKKQQQQQPRDAPGRWDVTGPTCCQAPPVRGARAAGPVGLEFTSRGF